LFESDNVTKPPNPHNKRQQGKPKKKRLGPRCKYVDPTESKIKCSICGDAGHNKKTCEARKVAAAKVFNKGGSTASLVELVNNGINQLLRYLLITLMEEYP
jgi:hypothetical protein